MSKNINDLNIRREDALDILDRTIGFINSCDNKAATVLGFFGVIIALIFTFDGISSITEIIGCLIRNVSFFYVLFLVFWFASLIVFGYGIYKLLSVLFAKIDCSDMMEDDFEMDSKIFFGDIAKNVTFKLYKKKLLSCDSEMIINDIISQIYINSVICQRKFNRYNNGLRSVLLGFVCFTILWIIGTYIN